jgi:uncharacterized membrane protein
MSAANVLVITVFAVFLVGVMAGIVVVYALSAGKARRTHDRKRSGEAHDTSRRRKSDLPV